MTKTRSRFLSLFIIFSLLIGIAGVANVDVSYAASKKVHLKKTSVTLVAGKKYQQKLINKNGKTIKASKVKWKSLKKSVAKISKKGKITALKAGTAKMTAKYKGKTYKFTVKVKKPAAPAPVDYNTKVSVDQESMDVSAGETVSLIVKTDLGKDITYTVSNKNISCSWGKWIDGTTNRYLYVTGEKEGSSVITISDVKNQNAAVAVTVTVKDPHVINVPPTASCKEYDSEGNVVGDVNITTITVEKKYLKLLDKYQVIIRISGTRTKASDDVELRKIAKVSVSLCQNGVSKYTDDILVNGDSFTNAECIIPNVEKGEYELVVNDARP